MNKPLLEIAAFNLESAQIAARAGADRVELCSGLAAGGLTPTWDDIIQAKQTLTCSFFVMIRPRGGDFTYTAAEVAQMKTDLQHAKSLGADGFVFGIIDEYGEIDAEANKALTELAHPLPCTFHRAFDDLPDKAAALETLISCGFQRVLTSGGTGNVADYTSKLKQLVQQAAGRITIMPGGGIRGGNIMHIQKETGAAEYHSAAITDGGSLANTAAIQEMRKLIA